MIDERAMMANARLAQVASPTAQREAMDLQREQMQKQETFANLQVAQNIVMSQYLYLDESESKSEDAKKLRASAKGLIQRYFDGLKQTD